MKLVESKKEYTLEGIDQLVQYVCVTTAKNFHKRKKENRTDQKSEVFFRFHSTTLTVRAPSRNIVNATAASDTSNSTSIPMFGKGLYSTENN